MIADLLPALRATIVLTFITGAIYPAAVLGLAQVVFSDQARGSLVVETRADGSEVLRGSRLIGQAWTKPEYLWGRPSAAGYDGANSCGSNWSPVTSEITARIVAKRNELVAANPDAEGEPPLQLVTTSGSGLDPHISPEAALWQVPRIARARGVDPSRVEALVHEGGLIHEGRTLGLLGEPRVNVLELNLELDRRFPLSN